MLSFPVLSIIRKYCFSSQLNTGLFSVLGIQHPTGSFCLKFPCSLNHTWSTEHLSQLDLHSPMGLKLTSTRNIYSAFMKGEPGWRPAHAAVWCMMWSGTTYQPAVCRRNSSHFTAPSNCTFSLHQGFQFACRPHLSPFTACCSHKLARAGSSHTACVYWDIIHI